MAAAGAIAGGVGSALGGAGGSMKGSKSKGSQESVAANELINIFRESYEAGKPLQEELSTQFMDILRTGGSQALTPAISRAREASNLAGARALETLETDLARTGQSRSPWGVAQKAALQSETMYKTGQIGPQMQFQFLQQMMPLMSNYASSQMGTLAQGLGAAVSGTYQSKEKTTPTKTSFLGMGG